VLTFAAPDVATVRMGLGGFLNGLSPIVPSPFRDRRSGRGSAGLVVDAEMTSYSRASGGACTQAGPQLAIWEMTGSARQTGRLACGNHPTAAG
jgi:hypothetical protein